MLPLLVEGGVCRWLAKWKLLIFLDLYPTGQFLELLDLGCGDPPTLMDAFLYHWLRLLCRHAYADFP